MPRDLQVRPAASDAELAALAAVLSECFCFEPVRASTWFQRAELPNVRVAVEGEAVLGGFLSPPAGQFFGGRRVSTAGLAGVGVRPELRRTGVAAEMLRRGLLDLHAEGHALSTLYASTQSLYRKVGFERAGCRYRCTVSADALRMTDRELDLRRLGEDDEPAVAALYTEQAARRPGHMDRSPYYWLLADRVRDGGLRSTYGAVGPAGELEGYVRYRQLPGDGFSGYRLLVTDFVALTGRAARRLWTQLSDQASMAREIELSLAEHDPVAAVLPERRLRVELLEHFMLRILDVPRALEQRGYPAGVAATIGLDLADDLVASNEGRFLLQIEGGRAEIRRGGPGAARLSVRALAPLFSGFLTAEALATLGWLEAPTEVVALLDTVFAGPSPWMTEVF